MLPLLYVKVQNRLHQLLLDEVFASSKPLNINYMLLIFHCEDEVSYVGANKYAIHNQLVGNLKQKAGDASCILQRFQLAVVVCLS